MPFLCLLLLATAPLACGGTVESTTDTGGSGGSGGTGAAGGSGGSGGTGATGGSGGAQGTCSSEEEAIGYDEPPPLGFQSSTPASPMTAVIESITESSIEYTLGPGGTVDTFAWRGPSLLDVFNDGDTVTVGTSEGWHYVAGGSKIAAAYTGYQFVPPDALPAVPMSKVPVLGYATQCSFPEGGGACDQPAADVRLLAVQVGTGADATLVPVGETWTSGDFQVHNAQSTALPGYGNEDCILEALFMSGVTVIAPIGK
jgi:hypothetical protein